jgi:hypothetical protein
LPPALLCRDCQGGHDPESPKRRELPFISGNASQCIDNPEFFQMIPGGELPEEVKKKKFETLPQGERIYRDVGSLVFYQVSEDDLLPEKNDRIRLILEKLSQYKEFEYLKRQCLQKTKKEKCLNIPDASLVRNMLVPIPLDLSKCVISDAQFFEFANKAIDEMMHDPKYGDSVKRIVKKVGKRELLAVMYAIAKQESSEGGPIGSLAVYRWEPGHTAFSFSIYHILMEKNEDGKTPGPGLRARRSLDMTEGHLYHPLNASKAFLAFLCEKSKKNGSCDPERFFPLMQNLEEFVDFYNGAGHSKKNPRYVGNITQYYGRASAILK